MRGKKQETETSRRETMGCCVVLHLEHEAMKILLQCLCAVNNSSVCSIEYFPNIHQLKKTVYHCKCANNLVCERERETQEQTAHCISQRVALKQ